jgi:hypothetical protein
LIFIRSIGWYELYTIEKNLNDSATIHDQDHEVLLIITIFKQEAKVHLYILFTIVIRDRHHDEIGSKIINPKVHICLCAVTQNIDDYA